MADGQDPYAAQHMSLVIIHKALLDNYTTLATCDVDATQVERAGPMARFLLAHHDAESLVLFPFLRKRTRLTSEDVGFLDAREREHRVVHDLCERLLAEAGAPHPSPQELAVVARAIKEVLEPHCAEEERGLTAEHLRAMIAPEEIAELVAEQEAFRAKYPGRI
ncbi:MAG: hemerythrin domain-containing protein [Deltaproteobacteria bacterium]|nr:hemerythrin domain-containing protein [Deltaproteobacteria bacterium]